MGRHLKILEMAANDGLPESIDEGTGLPLDIITELVEAGYLKAIDASSFEGIAYIAPKITLPGREYLERLRIQERSSTIKMVTPQIRLFISHSAADRDLVERLLELIRSALGLPAPQIRCTSIDGYRLPVGAKTDERLRQEVHEADAFVGIISSRSLHSLYVAFELGARWGAGLSLFPVLAPGTDPSVLGGPLAGLNALSAASRPQLHQLISDLANALGIKSEEPAVYERHLEGVLQLTKQGDLIPNNNDKLSAGTTLPPKCVEIMQIIAQVGDYKLTPTDISRRVKENLTRTQYYLDQLLDREFIHDSLSYSGPTTYGLTTAGRAYLVKQGLV